MSNHRNSNIMRGLPRNTPAHADMVEPAELPAIPFRVDLGADREVVFKEYAGLVNGQPTNLVANSFAPIPLPSGQAASPLVFATLDRPHAQVDAFVSLSLPNGGWANFGSTQNDPSGGGGTQNKGSCPFMLWGVLYGVINGRRFPVARGTWFFPIGTYVFEQAISFRLLTATQEAESYELTLQWFANSQVTGTTGLLDGTFLFDMNVVLVGSEGGGSSLPSRRAWFPSNRGIPLATYGVIRDCELYKLRIMNNTATTVWLMLFDGVSPSPGSCPLESIHCLANTEKVVTYDTPLLFEAAILNPGGNGLLWYVSSTPGTYTASAITLNVDMEIA